MMMMMINIIDRNMNIVEAELFDADLIFFASLCFSELFMEHALQSIGRYMKNIDDKDDDDGGSSSYDDDDDDDDVIDDTSINRHQHNFRLLQHTIMTSTRTNIHSYLHSYKHIKHTYIHIYIHIKHAYKTYIHTTIYTTIQPYIHAFIQAHKHIYIHPIMLIHFFYAIYTGSKMKPSSKLLLLTLPKTYPLLYSLEKTTTMHLSYCGRVAVYVLVKK